MKNKIIDLLKAGTRLVDKDPKYMVHQDHVRRIKARYALMAEKMKGRVA
jgi:hypothetical protein